MADDGLLEGDDSNHDTVDSKEKKLTTHSPTQHNHTAISHAPSTTLGLLRLLGLLGSLGLVESVELLGLLGLLGLRVIRVVRVFTPTCSLTFWL